MTEDEAAELAARIERDLLAEPGVAVLYPASGGVLLREAAAKLVGADDTGPRVVVRTGEPVQVDVSSASTAAARPARPPVRRSASSGAPRPPPCGSASRSPMWMPPPPPELTPLTRGDDQHRMSRSAHEPPVPPVLIVASCADRNSAGGVGHRDGPPEWIHDRRRRRPRPRPRRRRPAHLGADRRLHHARARAHPGRGAPTPSTCTRSCAVSSAACTTHSSTRRSAAGGSCSCSTTSTAGSRRGARRS